MYVLRLFLKIYALDNLCSLYFYVFITFIYLRKCPSKTLHIHMHICSCHCYFGESKFPIWEYHKKVFKMQSTIIFYATVSDANKATFLNFVFNKLYFNAYIK